MKPKFLKLPLRFRFSFDLEITIALVILVTVGCIYFKYGTYLDALNEHLDIRFNSNVAYESRAERFVMYRCDALLDTHHCGGLCDRLKVPIIDFSRCVRIYSLITFPLGNYECLLMVAPI
jgi:hypothetical protein